MLLAVSPVRFTSLEFVAGAAGLVEDLAEGSKKAIVLGRSAVANPDVARVTKRGAGTHGNCLLSKSSDDGLLIGVAEIDPGEVGLGLGRVQAQLMQTLLHADPLNQGPLDSLLDVILVQNRLGRRRLGEGIDAERLAHSIDRGAELGRAKGETDP